VWPTFSCVTGGSLKRSLGMAPTDGFTPSRNTQYAIRDTIIVQGIIDMLIRTPHGLIVIDFKTDNISASQAAQRAELYRGQLDLYARAASKILNAESATRHLYFLSPRLLIEVK
jgi:ATP-dependent exoDNAse (exonuclease V) beta subunit